MLLSERLKCVTDMVTRGNIVADVGCDHAYTSIYLIENHIASHVIAMDVNAGPLSHARDNINKHNLGDMIDTCLSDGLAALDEADGVETVLISGIGGNLMINILENGHDIVRGLDELVLQPQSDIYKVRHYLHENEYRIACEKLINEDGKFYDIIRAEPGKESYDHEYEYIYGRYLLDNADEVLVTFLEQLHARSIAAIAAIKQYSGDCDKNRERLLELMDTENVLKELLRNKCTDGIMG